MFINNCTIFIKSIKLSDKSLLKNKWGDSLKVKNLNLITWIPTFAGMTTRIIKNTLAFFL